LYVVVQKLRGARATAPRHSAEVEVEAPAGSA
jgi:hypothetical protein